MEKYLEQEEVVNFIQENWQKNIVDLAFKLSKSNLPKDFILHMP